MLLRTAILFSILMSACTKGEPEFALLNSLSGIQFDGKISKTITIDTLGSPIVIEGSCDRTSTEFLLSKDNGSSWSNAKSDMGERFEDNCRQKSSLKLTLLTDNTGLFSFTNGIAVKHTLKIIAKAGVAQTKEAEIIINYEPNSTYVPPKPVAGVFVTPAAGVVSSSNYKMSYRLKPAHVKAEGSNYKIKSIH